MAKTTLKDIAAHTGFSVATVSRALNNSTKISSRTKTKVQQSARALQYPVQHFTNGSAPSSTLRVGLVISGFHIGEFYSSYYKGFTDFAQQNNMLLSIISLRRNDNVFTDYLKKAAAVNDGLILFTPEFARSDYLALQNELPDGYPIISNGLIENPVVSTITFDSYSGGHSAAQHFCTKGYYQCGVIKGPLDKTEARYRFNGFNDFVDRHSNMQLQWHFDGDYSFESGVQAFATFAKLEQKPSAIFACNDAMCHGFMEAASKHQYEFPDDVAVIGFDDLPICTRHHPAITSVATPYDELGRVTLQQLESTIQQPKQQSGMLSLLPVELKVRESS